MNDLGILERLPERIRISPYTQAIVDPMTSLGREYWEATRDLSNQFFPPTATWALSEWERLVKIIPDAGQTLEERRRAVITKLCSTGTTNSEMIRALAEALTGYGATVTENFSDYSFSLRFYGEEATFINIDTQLLINTVEEIKPAHLRFIIEKIRWEDIEAVGMTWEQLEARFKSWNELENSFFCHGPGGNS